MSAADSKAFDRFLTLRNKDLRRIARHTQGEMELCDVQSEAWLMAQRLFERRGVLIEFDNAQHQELLLSHLYQQLVRYTELQVRHAVRLDHWAHGDDPANDTHPILNKLSADDSSDPLALLVAKEEASAELVDASHHGSLAGAYVRLLHHFDNRMQTVAEHLLISLSYCYQRCRKARVLVQWQLSLPIDVDHDRLPGAWRRFKLPPAPVQLQFEFAEATGLWPE